MLNKIHIVNGPNLNLLGKREPHIYGGVTFESYFEELKLKYPEMDLHYFQSNHEGVILDYLHAYGFEKETGMVLNAGGLSHTSIVLRDAVSAIQTPVVEVHISNIYNRETFRWHSFLTEVCVSHIIGKGLKGYDLAIEFLCSYSK